MKTLIDHEHAKETIINALRFAIVDHMAQCLRAGRKSDQTALKLWEDAITLTEAVL